jgi:glutathione S-transferase
VPVLVDTNGSVIDESLDIMLWALQRNDPEGWLSPEHENLAAMLTLIRHFDEHFKWHLDRYKYPYRFADAKAEVSRDAAMVSLQMLEERLRDTSYLFGKRPALADMAIAPFVRQFSSVDRAWLSGQPLTRTIQWLAAIVESPRFTRVMRSTAAWSDGTVGERFP